MKRIFDIIFSIIGIIIFSPLMLIIALLVRLFSSTPIFFIQKRVGMDEVEFCLYKFCTMTDEGKSENSTYLTIQNNPRITGIGKILRKCKLDEIPSLFNVLRGDMSFVVKLSSQNCFVGMIAQLCLTWLFRFVYSFRSGYYLIIIGFQFFESMIF